MRAFFSLHTLQLSFAVRNTHEAKEDLPKDVERVVAWELEYVDEEEGIDLTDAHHDPYHRVENEGEGIVVRVPVILDPAARGHDLGKFVQLQLEKPREILGPVEGGPVQHPLGEHSEVHADQKVGNEPGGSFVGRWSKM